MKTLREMTVHPAFRFTGLALRFAAGTVVVPAARLAAQEKHDPLGRLVTEALARNLGLTAERLADQRAAADVRAARGLFLPSLGVASRYSYLDGVPNIGDFVNPAYAAVNGLLGQNRFPTNLDITLPQRHDSHAELRHPLFNAGILANYAPARRRADGQRFALLAASRRLSVEVQTAYLNEASARRAVEIYAASLALVQEYERVAERLVAAGRATPRAAFPARAERREIEQHMAEARERDAARDHGPTHIRRRPL